jgi:hypothetical protein
MICPDCQTENKEPAAFCTRCGRTLWPPPQVDSDATPTPVTHKPVTPDEVWDDDIPEIVVKTPAEQPDDETERPATKRGSDEGISDPEVLMQLAMARSAEDRQRMERTRSWVLVLGVCALVLGAVLTWYVNSRRGGSGEEQQPGETRIEVGVQTTEVIIYEVHLARGIDEMGQPEGWGTTFPADRPPMCFLTYEITGTEKKVPLKARFLRDGREVGERTVHHLDPSNKETNFELRWPTPSPAAGEWLVGFYVGDEKLASSEVVLTPAARLPDAEGP